MELREERYRMEGSCESDDEMTTIEEKSVGSPFRRKGRMEERMADYEDNEV